MTDLNPPGSYQSDWKSVKDGKCRHCGSPNIEYRLWESSCGGYEDYKYRCTNCDEIWWVEGPDA